VARFVKEGTVGLDSTRRYCHRRVEIRPLAINGALLRGDVAKSSFDDA
jgi:hypothetical protein